MKKLNINFRNMQFPNITFLVIVTFLLCSFLPSSLEEYRTVKHSSFRRGEKLTYLAHYSFLHAGVATVYMDPQVYAVNNRACYKVDIVGKSVGLFAAMMHVNDSWQSYIDTSAMIPHKFVRKVEEGSYRKQETVLFDHFKKTANVSYKVNKEAEKVEQYKILTHAQDLVSGYYFLRTLDFTNKRINDTIGIDGFFENKNYSLKIKYLGKEVISTKVGKLNSEIIEPILPNNELFDGKGAIKIWISDDANRIPLKIKAKMFVGAVELDLTGYENLKTPLNFVKK
jgi:hypothetical protein